MQFKQGQKFRVIVNGVSVYTTAKQIRWGFGDFVSINHAVESAFVQLQNAMKTTTGLCTRVGEVDVQIDTL